MRALWCPEQLARWKGLQQETISRITLFRFEQITVLRLHCHTTAVHSVPKVRPSNETKERAQSQPLDLQSSSVSFVVSSMVLNLIPNSFRSLSGTYLTMYLAEAGS